MIRKIAHPQDRVVILQKSLHGKLQVLPIIGVFLPLRYELRKVHDDLLDELHFLCKELRKELKNEIFSMNVPHNRHCNSICG